MPQIPIEVRKARAQTLTASARQITDKFINAQIGKTYSVLTEQTAGGFVTGYTENYIKMYLPRTTPLNKVLTVKITAPHSDGATGEKLENRD